MIISNIYHICDVIYGVNVNGAKKPYTSKTIVKVKNGRITNDIETKEASAFLPKFKQGYKVSNFEMTESESKAQRLKSTCNHHAFEPWALSVLPINLPIWCKILL